MLLYVIAFVFLLAAFIFTVGVALVYFGIFDRIDVSTGTSPFPFAGAELAYKLGKGKPGDSGALFTEVCSIVPGKTTLGMFLELEDPDPANPLAERKTRCKTFSSKFNPSSDECHFLVGVITADVNKQATVTESDRQLLAEKGFKFTHLPASENVVFSNFPYRGIISVVVGLRRVYPSLLQYITEHRLCAYPAMEIYDRDTIYYILPLSQQSQFVSLFQIEGDNAEPTTDSDTEVEEEGEEESSSEAAHSYSSFEEL